MKLFDLIAGLLVLAAIFSYLNLRLLKLPATIGLMALSLVFSIMLVLAGWLVPPVGVQVRAIVEGLEFDEALLHGMLGFLLFAGAMHVNLSDLARHRWPIAALATAGVLISTFIVGGVMWAVTQLLGLRIGPLNCLVFGALISPTDPIAVMGLLKQIGAPKDLEVQIAGESLFNDGVGVVIFAGLLELAEGGSDVGFAQVAGLFVREAIGGAVFGLVAGMVVYRLLRSVDHYQVEILLSLALVAGGYALADALHLSGPIAMVVAGLVIGNHGRAYAMSETTRQRLDQFWELVDEFLNAVLFVLIGLEVVLLTFERRYVAAGLLAIPIVLAARWISVAAPLRLLRKWERFGPATVPVLTWGGLRGGISVALALSLPEGPHHGGVTGRDVLLTITYCVVAFSILVQGLTIGAFTRRWLRVGKAVDPGPIPGPAA